MSNEIYELNYHDFYHPDKCIGDLGEKWCNFKWRIYNLHLNPQETCQSPVFTTRLLQNTQWYLEVKLSKPGDLRTLKLSLRRLPSAKNSISVVDVIYKFECHPLKKISDKNTFVYNNETKWNDRYDYCVSFWKLKNLYVTVECNLRPNKAMIQDVRHENLDETLPVNFRQLLQSGELCDTIIRVGNEELMAHYVILCARLRNLLPSEIKMENGKRIINIDNLPVSVVKEMLKYAYTGQAYVELDSVLVHKDILLKYSKDFFQRCCWEDNPFATTFFSYETDSISWDLNKVSEISNLGVRRIELLRISPKELEFSLDVLESEEEKKKLTLTFKYRNKEMPKSTVICCKYSLVNVESDEKLDLEEKESLLHSNITQGKMELCSLLDVMRGNSTLKARKGTLILKTDFKFCYGSSRSSIENLYEGQFDISQCTSCALLSVDMENLHRFVKFEDIAVESRDGRKISAHKAILIARWKEAETLGVKENSQIVMNDYDYHDLCELFRRLYSGNSSKQL